MACDGRRADIIRCQTHQPPIDDPNDYFFYMWADSVQGIFLLRQHFLEGRPQQWWLMGEVEGVEATPTAFEELSDKMKELLDAGELDVPVEQDHEQGRDVD